MYSLQGLDAEVKLILYKMLIMPLITYPVTPLNAASMSGMLKLQTVQNKALNFVYNTGWPNVVTSKNLHLRAGLDPINQVIHRRASSIWDKIEAGIAADRDSFIRISSIPYINPHRLFPSSLVRARKPEPPPIFTQDDTFSPQINDYFGN